MASERASIPTLTLARCWSTSTASRSHASTCPPPRAPPRAGRRGARFAVRGKAACSGRARRRRPSATTICPLGAESRSLSFRTTPPAANTTQAGYTVHVRACCEHVLCTRACWSRASRLNHPTPSYATVRPFSQHPRSILPCQSPNLPGRSRCATDHARRAPSRRGPALPRLPHDRTVATVQPICRAADETRGASWGARPGSALDAGTCPRDWLKAS